MLEMRTDRRVAKCLAAGLATTILAAELTHDAALPEHSPHAGPALPNPARRAVAAGGSVQGRALTWLNYRGEPIQFVGGGGHPLTFVANGRLSELAGLVLPAARE